MIELFALAFGFGLIVVAILLDGYALWVLWGWFAVPIFGLPTLTISQAIGVSLTIGFLTHQYYATPDGKNWERFCWMFWHPTLVLGVGWIVKQWAHA